MKKLDFSRNKRKKNKSNTVHNSNWNRNQGTLNAKDPDNNNCHSPTINISNLHNQQNILSTNHNNSQHFDMSISNTCSVSTQSRIQLYQHIQLYASFENTPISSSSPGTNELDIFSSQYNSRKFNPSHDQKISKYKPLTYKIETSVFSNKNWPTYKPVGVRYLDRVTNSK